MAGYQNLLEAVIKRQFGIIGREGVFSIVQGLDFEVDQEGNILKFNEENGKELLGKLMEKFLESHGLISIIGCRIQIRKMAKEQNLELPQIFE